MLVETPAFVRQQPNPVPYRDTTGAGICTASKGAFWKTEVGRRELVVVEIARDVGQGDKVAPRHLFRKNQLERSCIRGGGVRPLCIYARNYR